MVHCTIGRSQCHVIDFRIYATLPLLHQKKGRSGKKILPWVYRQLLARV